MMILAVFRSRSQSLDYAECLHKYGVSVTTTPAPSEAKIGCGLCIRFEERYYPRASALLRTKKYSSFKGFYKLDFVGGQVSLLPYHGQERM